MLGLPPEVPSSEPIPITQNGQNENFENNENPVIILTYGFLRPFMFVTL